MKLSELELKACFSTERDQGACIGVLCTFCGEPYSMGNYAIIQPDTNSFLIIDKTSTCPMCGYGGLFTLALFDSEDEIRAFFYEQQKNGVTFTLLPGKSLYLTNIRKQ